MAPINRFLIKAAAAITAAGQQQITSKQVEGQFITQRDVNGPGFVTVDTYRKPMDLPTIDWQTPATTDSTIIIRDQPQQNPEDFANDDGKFHQFAPTEEEKKKNKHLAQICDKFLAKPTPEEIKAYAKCPGQALTIEGAQTAALAVVADTISSNAAGAARPLITAGEHNNKTFNFTTSYNTSTHYNHHSVLQNRTFGIDNADAFTPKPAAAMPFTIQIGLVVVATIAIVCIIFGIVFYNRRQQNKKQATLLPRYKSDAGLDFGVKDGEEKHDFLYEWQPQSVIQWKSGWTERDYGVWSGLQENKENIEWETQTLRASKDNLIERK